VPDERRFLEMDDGVRIAVNLHFPDTPPPWPVVFEARPYRKDDFSDATAIYRRFCDEGDLAVCRADVRGIGSSEGVAEDEYTDRELRDHVATIAWLAEQEWSNGNVGMYGTSYSGFNSLQVAALRPPALKAIVPIYATDRRYTDDVHYGGGARWFMSQHVAFNFDMRFYRIPEQEADDAADVPFQPKSRLFLISAGLSFK